MPWYGDSFPFTEAAILATARQASGVYAIWDASTGDCATVYIGESDDVRASLLEHRRGLDTCIASYAPTRCGVEYVAKEYRGQRQNLLVAEFEPCCNETWWPRLLPRTGCKP